MILVFGSINLDLVARVPRLPGPGETLSGTSFVALPGGKGANQALAARHAGAQVALVAAIGSDSFAMPATAGLAAAGIDITGVAVVEDSTGVALIHIDAAGENAITVIPGANARALASAIDAPLWSRASTLLLQLEVPLTEAISAASEARARGIRVVLNAAPMQPLPSALLAAIDVLIVNEHEAGMLAAALSIDAEAGELADALAHHLGIAVVLTLGAEGAIAATAGDRLHARPPPVDVVDSTGAGDALAGALTAALDRGASWPQALREAVAAGSLACGSVGAQAALADGGRIADVALQVELVTSTSLPF